MISKPDIYEDVLMKAGSVTELLAKGEVDLPDSSFHSASRLRTLSREKLSGVLKSLTAYEKILIRNAVGDRQCTEEESLDFFLDEIGYKRVHDFSSSVEGLGINCMDFSFVSFYQQPE